MFTNHKRESSIFHLFLFHNHDKWPVEFLGAKKHDTSIHTFVTLRSSSSSTQSSIILVRCIKSLIRQIHSTIESHKNRCLPFKFTKFAFFFAFSNKEFQFSFLVSTGFPSVAVAKLVHHWLSLKKSACPGPLNKNEKRHLLQKKNTYTFKGICVQYDRYNHIKYYLKIFSEVILRSNHKFIICFHSTHNSLKHTKILFFFELNIKQHMISFVL